MKRTQDVDFDALFDSLRTDGGDEAKPEHQAWADLDESDDDLDDED
jgi:hypothetical protein